MVLTTLSCIARFGVLSSSIVVLGLGVTFIENRASSLEFLIYIEVLSALTVPGSIVPPYPNFVYDLVWTLAWSVAAAFAMVVQFFESDCYGFRPDGKIGCATYKASTAFSFLCMFAWLASTLFGALRIVDAKFDIRSLATNRPVSAGTGGQEQEVKRKDKESKRGGSNEEIKDVPPGEGRKETKKVKGFGNSHIASYLISYCIIGVVLMAIGSAVLLIWGAPAFGRHIIYRAPIPDYSVILTNPTNSSISFAVSTNIRVPDRFKISVDPMHADFFLPDSQLYTVPLATVDLAKMVFHSNERLEFVNQTLKFGNLNEFTKLVEQVVYQPIFRVVGQSRAKIRLPPIPATWIDIDGAAELPAFDNFVQIDIRDVRVHLPEAEGYNMVAEMVMVNVTPVYLTLGDVYLQILIGDIQIGQAFVPLNGIVPGNNTLFVKGIMDYGNIQKNIISILKTEAPYLERGLFMASALVESVVNEGQHLSYWEKSFQSIKVSATTPIKPLFSSVIGNGFESAPIEIPGSGGDGDAITSLADKVLKTINDLSASNHISIWN
ncbi:hypothetical protein ACJ73_00562 [Blastomyces percursus]|uniref:MARVEL domain-containing protein n=1 Tax=Blastomyces percursus TaxID=1658174 RepID=A0A1J9QHR2_9EURO|nr:hypothetical protein ACJ73_00562 [Blastomyces percursus]